MYDSCSKFNFENVNFDYVVCTYWKPHYTLFSPTVYHVFQCSLSAAAAAALPFQNRKKMFQWNLNKGICFLHLSTECYKQQFAATAAVLLLVHSIESWASMSNSTVRSFQPQLCRQRIFVLQWPGRAHWASEWAGQPSSPSPAQQLPQQGYKYIKRLSSTARSSIIFESWQFSPAKPEKNNLKIWLIWI